jgi:hypothetical protein
MTPGTKIDVELFGGPLDGHRTEVRLMKPGFDVWLFRYCHCEGLPRVMAYSMSGRTTADGRVWVLNFLYEVAKIGATKKGGEE